MSEDTSSVSGCSEVRLQIDFCTQCNQPAVRLDVQGFSLHHFFLNIIHHGVGKSEWGRDLGFRVLLRASEQAGKQDEGLYGKAC